MNLKFVTLLIFFNIHDCFSLFAAPNQPAQRPSVNAKSILDLSSSSYFFSGEVNYGHGMGYKQCPVSDVPSMDEYFNTELQKLGAWVLSKAPDSDMISINVSDASIKNSFFHVNMMLTETKLVDLVSKLKPTCVRAHLDRGLLVATFSAVNVTQSGNYFAHGTLWDKHNFEGKGEWEIVYDMKCDLNAFFNYSDATHLGLQKVVKSDYRRFGLYCSPNRNNNNDGSNIKLYKLENLFQNVTLVETEQSVEKLKGLETYVKAVVIKNVLRSTFINAYRKIQQTLMPLFSEYLEAMLQKKSIFELMNE